MAAPFITSNHEQKNLTPNNTQTFQVPRYDKIMSIMLHFTTGAGATATEADVRAEIGQIRLSINGQDVVNSLAPAIYDAYEVMGVRVSSPGGIGGVLELNMGPLIYKDPFAQEMLGFGTANIDTIQVSITAGTLNNIANCQIITARIPTPVPQNRGPYCRFIDYNQSASGAGEVTVDTLPRDPNTAYLMLMVSQGSTTITAGELSVNSRRIRELLNTSVNAQMMSNFGLTQIGGYYVYNFCDGTLTGRLPMKDADGKQIGDFRIKTTFAGVPNNYAIRALTVENMPTGT